jgi:UDP-glucose 4-epimerase
VKWGPLVKGDLIDSSSINAALAEHRSVGVMHIAALSLVGAAM